jgi:DNA-binding beta-propeller fold protein YncE
MRTRSALVLTLLVCYVGIASAQVREDWVIRHDGLASQGDGARHIAVDKWGNVYVTGGTCTLIWIGNPEFGCTTGAWTTLKYDADGNKLWSASYGGPANFAGSPAGVAVDSAGNVYVTGSMCLYAVFDWVSLWCSGSDYTTIKYGTNGNQLWVAHYASPVEDAVASAMVVDAAGNVHVTGSSMGVDYAYDYVTIKYDTNGNQLWLARYNGPENAGDSAYAIALGAAGAVYVTGYSGGTASTETATIKYDANGNQMWAARSGEDAAVAIVTIGPERLFSMSPGMCM